MIAMIVAAALNSAVSQANIDETVCRPGWTHSIRPPHAYTEALKRSQLGWTVSPRAYEEDHIMPLCLGGAPYNPANLRPQLWDEARRKDHEEGLLCRAVCLHFLSLDEARQIMSKDWP